MKLILADGREHQLLAGVLTLGRDDSCDVVITDSLISRRHVEIHTDTQGSVIVDLGSRNGTFVNGQRIAARQPRPLRAGDQIQLGRNVQMTVQGTAARDIPTLAADMPPTGAPTMDLPPPAPAATPFWKSRWMWGFALAVAVLIALGGCLVGRFLFGNGGEEAASMLPATATLPAARTATLIEMPVITASLTPPPATPTVEARSTVSLTPTSAPATATSSMTTLPSPTETVSATATPVAPMPISVDNATNVMQLAVRESKCIQDIAISPDGRFVATAGAANYRGVYLYDRVTLNELRFMKTSGAVASVAFSPDGLILAAAGCIRSDEDGTIWLFDVSTGQQLGTLTGHTEPAVGVAFSPDGTMLASSSWDKTVRLWDVRTAQELRVLTGHTSSVYDVKFSPDGMLLATAGGVSDTTVRIWNVHNGQIQHILAGHESAVYSVAFSPDGTLLVSGGDDKVRLWDIATARELRTLAPWDFVREHDTRLRGLYTKSVYSLAFNPEGTIVAVGSGIHDVLLWDVTTGQVLHSLIGHESEVMGVAFSSDGTVLVTGNCRLSDSMRLWGITAEDEREGTVHPTTSPVPAASSSPTPPLTSTSPSLLYQDNFADTVQWHRGVGITTAEERFVEAHEYHIIVKTAPHLAWDYHQAARIADFKAEVDARVIQEPTGGDGDYEYGMIFRFVDADNFLCFVVRRDGAVQIAEQTNSRWQVIQDWRRNSAVRAAPDTNHFEVIGNGADVAIYANQQHITTFSTDNESTGYIGVLVGAFDQRPNIQVAFKELAVWTLTAKPDIPKPVATTTRQAGVKPPPPTALANLGVVVKNWLGQDAVIIGGEGKNEQNQALTMPEQHIPPNAEIVMQLHPGHYNWYANTGSPQCERCAFMGEIDVYAGQMTKIQLYIDDNKVLQGVVE